ncbi:MAG: TIR domain-containing protein [Bacteroidota bacterium]
MNSEMLFAQNLVAEDRLDEVFVYLNGIWQDGQTHLFHHLVLLSARYQAWQEKFYRGFEPPAQELNLIRSHLLDLISSHSTSIPPHTKIQNPMHYTNLRKQHLKKRITSISTLLQEWEIKRDMAENPNEILRCEHEITKLENHLAKYEQELGGLEILSIEEDSQISHTPPLYYDAFISFAEQDKDSFVLPLIEALKLRGKSIWCSAIELHIGDSISEEINRAISLSKFGILILSPNYFKKWPINELNALFAKYTSGEHNLLLPIWHNLSYENVLSKIPLIADKFAISSAKGIEVVADSIDKTMSRRSSTR